MGDRKTTIEHCKVGDWSQEWATLPDGSTLSGLVVEAERMRHLVHATVAAADGRFWGLTLNTQDGRLFLEDVTAVHKDVSYHGGQQGPGAPAAKHRPSGYHDGKACP